RANLPRRRCLVGTSGRGASGLTQCKLHRAGNIARDLCRSQRGNGSGPHAADLKETNDCYTLRYGLSASRCFENSLAQPAGPRFLCNFAPGAAIVKIFLAGAAGAIGKRLVPLLLSARHDVIGTTRSTTKADALRAAGVEAVVVDVFDEPALSRAIASARPDIVVHQLTDLPSGLDPARMAEGTRRNARMRS